MEDKKEKYVYPTIEVIELSDLDLIITGSDEYLGEYEITDSISLD